MAKPEIPKQLATRIKSAQRKVSNVRSTIMHGDRRIDQARRRVSLYDASPYAYADEYYRSMDIDSYPVQTRIGRDREELAYYESKAPERLVELAQAEAELERIEEEVLLKVLVMRPSAGRVPWPRRLRVFKSERQATELRWARDDEKSKIQHERRMARLDAQCAKADEQFQKSMERLVQTMLNSIERLPKAKREAAKATLDEQTALLRAGEVGFFDVLSAIHW